MKVDTIRIARGADMVDVAIACSVIEADVYRCILEVGEDEARRIAGALTEGLDMLNVSIDPAAHEQAR